MNLVEVPRVEGSSHKRYACANSASTPGQDEEEVSVVAEILDGNPSRRHMRVNCRGILLQGKKDEPVTMSVVELDGGMQGLLLAEESIFAGNPRLRSIVVPRRSFGGDSTIRHIPLPLSKIPDGSIPIRQLSPMPGLMCIVFEPSRPTVAA